MPLLLFKIQNEGKGGGGGCFIAPLDPYGSTVPPLLIQTMNNNIIIIIIIIILITPNKAWEYEK